MQSLLWPIGTGTAASLAVWYWALYPVFMDAAERLTFAGSIASIGATMLGFMLAALAVLASINDTHLVKMMKRTGHYDNLLSTLLTGCLLFLFCAVGGYVVMFGYIPNAIFLSVTMGLHTAALVSLVEIGWKFNLVLRNLRTAE